MTRGLGCGLLAALAFLAISGRAGAQLSPGPLSAAHASLEGSTHCLECHRAGKGVGPELCLDCHGALAARIAAGAGLHARPGHDACERCHIEHHGRDFELVYWGDRGPRAFDHGESGRTLAGAHAALECRQCHRRERLAGAETLRRGGARLDTTYLGLAGDDCSSCHRDVHAGGVGGACASCHGEEHWKPAPGFDHDRAAWPLRGRHRGLGCDACHRRSRSPAAVEPSPEPARAGAPAAAGLFVSDVRGTSCASCHDDPHDGRLGGACAGCHRETGWSAVERGSFDHGQTRFPLVGRHAAVECAVCHRAGGVADRGPAERGKYERCDSCHADAHRGQLAGRVDGGDCRACHDENGFAPARFTLEDHGHTGYPLEGAHRAVSCDTCHTVLESAAPAGPSPAARSTGPAASPRPASASVARRYRFASTACSGCHHQTPHGETAGANAGASAGANGTADCGSCHDTSAWTAVRFDHASSRFPLVGAHAALACDACHDSARVGAWLGTAAASLPLTGLPLSCAGCHRDVHGGQFDRAGVAAVCDRCHGPDHWAPAARFDHDRDSRYPLAGAHRTAPCAGCHTVESSGVAAVVRYRPLATGCADCHAAAAPVAPSKGRPSDRSLDRP